MTEHDEETQRMLAELEAAEKQEPEPEDPEQAERERLIERAKILGIQVNGRAKNETIRQRIEEAEAAQQEQQEPEPEDPEQADVFTVINSGKNRRRIGGIDMAVGESHTLTEREMSDERLMKKINRAIKLGVLTRGAD